MTKRKVLNVLGVLSGLALTVVIAGFASLIAALPSPTDLVKKLPAKSQESVPAQPDLPHAVTSATESATTASVEALAQPETSEEKEKREKKELDAKNEALFEQLLTEDPSDIRVCDNLGRTQLSREDLARERDFHEMMSGRDDAMNEAFRSPILQVFNDPNLRSFIDEVKDIKSKTENQTEAEKESWLEKAGFYSRMAYAGARVFARKSEFEHMGNQSAHLMALAKLTALKPEIAANGQLQTLCRLIESRAKEGEASDLVSDRKAVVEIYRQAGVDPKTLGFDPSKWIHFTMKMDKKSLAFNLSDEVAPEKK